MSIKNNQQSIKSIIGQPRIITTSKVIMFVAVLATLMPQSILAQRDIEEVEQPPSWTHDTITQDISPVPHSVPTLTQALSYSKTTKIVAGIESNKIDPSTVLSYGQWWWVWSILCSTIARINLNTLTGLPYEQWVGSESSIARGDAYTIASEWLARAMMITSSVSWLEDDIWSQYTINRHTIFDVYFYKGSNYWVMQWHRAVVFIGTDNQIYILDTIRGKRWVRPQLLSDHFEADDYHWYHVYISSNSYVPATEYKTLEEYYLVQDSAPLTQLVQDGIVEIEDKWMVDDDITLIVKQQLKINPDTNDEIIIEAWWQITVKNAKTLIWWDLVYKPLPEAKILEAVYQTPIFGAFIWPLDTWI